MQPVQRTQTRSLALGGILLALLGILLFVSSITPVNRLSLLALSSFPVSVMVVEAGIRAGWTYYAASVPLAFLVMRDYTDVVPYILFFGIYGLVKFYVERLNRPVMEYIIKTAYFCACLGVLAIAVRQFLLDNVSLPWPVWLLAPLFAAVFLAYDYAYTLFIRFYNLKIRGRLKF